MTNSQFKDLFSVQAKDYAKYRPSYPAGLFEFLNSVSDKKDLAWDAGTGNGQCATELAKIFKHVIATDPSEKQIKEAQADLKITYKVEKAEAPSIQNNTVNLITVAQAFHWFDHKTFADACKKVAAPGCKLAVWCYANPHFNNHLDEVLHHLYEGILGPYWEKERKLVEEGYASIQMPFQELKVPPMKLEINWTSEQFIGYLKTWSALQTYLKTQSPEPIQKAFDDLRFAWGDEDTRMVAWNLGLRLWAI
jgi:ubiquinone/menaquinone biosynthesis C-methylase UbiE